MRLDIYLTEKGIIETRTKAKQAVVRGEIFVDGKAVLKPSFEVDENSDFKVEYKYNVNFVSLGGYKLQKALTCFNFSVQDKRAVDIGASTGGFTDCLLKNGAKKVYAIDLNDDLLHASLKNDARVTRIIKNAKNLTKQDFVDNIDLVVADLSFISATQILPVVSELIENEKQVIILIKPQFENDVKRRFKNGIIRDGKIRFEACKKVFTCANNCGLAPINITTAPINQEKNIEYLLLLKKQELCKQDDKNSFERFILQNNIQF